MQNPTKSLLCSCVVVCILQLAKSCPEKCICFNKVARCILQNFTSVPENIPLQTSVLDLRFNKIRHLPSGAFSHLFYLERLYINNNQLERVDSGAFDGLHSLRNLYIYRNNIKTLHSGIFRGLSNLRTLFLHRNKIDSIHPHAFSNMGHLLRLYLYENNLKRIPVEAFHPLTRLESLRIDSNALECDCKMVDFAKFLKNHTALRSQRSECSSPDDIQGRSLTELAVDNFDCDLPKVMKEPQSIQIRYGGMARFDCEFEGDQKPEIVWMKDEDKLDYHENDRLRMLSNGTLEIWNSTSEDEGFYECMAKTSVGSVRTRRAHLQLLQPEAPLIIRGPRSQSVDPGARLRLECRAYGDPLPILQWFFNGQPIYPSDNGNIRILRTGDLVIDRIDPSNEGQYLCRATGPTGAQAASHADIKVYSRPQFTLKPADLVVNEGTRVKLRCEVVGHPVSNVSWLYNGHALDSSRRRYQLFHNSTLLQIYPFLIRDVGRYSCRASNRNGAIQTEANVRIKESIPPRIIDGPRDSVVQQGSTAVFPCKATGTPEPRITWFFDGTPLLVSRSGHYTIDLDNTLTINQVRESDKGHYTCQAANLVGAQAAEARLKVTVTPNRNAPTTEFIRKTVDQATKNVDRAINNTQRLLLDKSPKSPSELLALFRYPGKQAVEFARAREIYDETLTLIGIHVRRGLKVNMTHKSNSSFDEILSVSHLQLIMELSGCTPMQFRDTCTDTCLHLKYRSFDGQCNNFDHPMYGVSLTPFKRIIPAIYENGFNTPVGWEETKLYYGYPKPNARLVSQRIAATEEVTADPKYTGFLMQWGQFLDHDIDFAVGATSRQVFSGGAVCNETCRNQPPCFNIKLPVNDHRRRQPVMSCMEFERSSAVCGSGATSVLFENVALREQINRITSFIDASQIYGSTEQEALDLRDLFNDHGLLRFDIVSHSQKPYLPFNRDAPMDCQRNYSRSHPIRCFLAGDFRANEQLGLLSLHTVFLRHHNNIAAKFLVMNQHWDGEKIYQETRKIIGAQLQHITYNHWLPKILGPEGMEMVGPYRGYRPDTDPSISNVFATAAFRFGHTLINPILYRLDATHRPIDQGHLPLHLAFFAPERLLTEGGVDPILRGLFATPAKQPRSDQLLNKELTEKLFSKAHEVALDLAALNIQRGRDHALPGYMEWRKWCNLTVTDSWDDLRDDIPNPYVLRKLQELYGHPRNMDLWVGGLVERLLPEARVGATFGCIIADQFRRLREGDRFWYENPSQFSTEQLTELKKTSLSRIICDNSDSIQRIQPDPFLYTGTTNIHSYGRCSEIAQLNLYMWQSCCDDSQSCSGFNSDYDLSNDIENDADNGHSRQKRSSASSEATEGDLSPSEEAYTEMEERLEGLEELLADLQNRLNSVQHTAERNAKLNSYCTDGKFRRENGDKWNVDVCTSCECKEGQVWCRVKSCLPVHCPNPAKIPFECCPVC